jgi:hypothetical protein
MKLPWQEPIDRDLLDDWRRHPVTLWLARALENEPRLRMEWRKLGNDPLELGRLQGKADALEAIVDIIKG